VSLALQSAHKLIEQRLQEHACTHLHTRIEGNSLYVYSVEDGEEAYRAAMTLCKTNEFALSIADHRGYWQPVPFRGEISEIADVLMSTFAFSLIRWPSQSARF